jgi:hypothetical protein
VTAHRVGVERTFSDDAATGFLLGQFSWRTVLVIEGLPPPVWAVVWLALIAEWPARAAWLSATQRTQIEDALAVTR